MIQNLAQKSYTLYDTDKNGRKIDIHKFQKVIFSKNFSFYPCVMFKSHDRVHYPVQERIMSLGTAQRQIDYQEANFKKALHIFNDPVFYFIYNTENYYHFIYDSLPYLISFFHVKKQHANLKLLVNFISPNQKKIYKFVLEFLQILGIHSDDTLVVDENLCYKTVFVSSSYTHGVDSNLPPRKEVYDFYKSLVRSARVKHSASNLPSKFYVSRRTWVHNDFSNIGTNYTTRRKLVNEDVLVEKLSYLGYEEVFTENLSTVEKVLLFNNAEHIIGAIGGGMCNVLFCPDKTKVTVLISPTFLEANQRFLHSFKNNKVDFFDDTFHTESDEWKLYMRVKSGNIVGEINDIQNDNLIISYTDKPISGWNSQDRFKKAIRKKAECLALDQGLNSFWGLDVDKFINFIRKSQY